MTTMELLLSDENQKLKARVEELEKIIRATYDPVGEPYIEPDYGEDVLEI